MLIVWTTFPPRWAGPRELERVMKGPEGAEASHNPTHYRDGDESLGHPG